MSEMKRKVEGTHTGLLKKKTGNQAQKKAYRTWVTPKAEVLLEAAGTHSEMPYIGRRQGTVAQWVALRPISEVSARETGYGGEGAGGMHGVDKRSHRHSLWQPWSKYNRKPGWGNMERGTHSRGQGETEGSGERGFGYYGMETGEAQVGG